MDISNLCVIGDKVSFRFVCQRCKKEVVVGDAFCRHCGRKLVTLPRVAEVADVASILTAAFKGRAILRQKANAVSPEVSASSTRDDAAKIEDNKESSLGFDSTHGLCPRCKDGKCGCEFLQPDGVCHAMCYLTNPPQYPKCVYSD